MYAMAGGVAFAMALLLSSLKGFPIDAHLLTHAALGVGVGLLISEICARVIDHLTDRKED
jgi:Na+/H+ antiporter NhaA